MTLKNQSNLDIANTVAQAKFDELFNTNRGTVASMFTESYSTGALTDENVMVTFLNKMREWLGAKEITPLEAFKQSIELSKYEFTFSLPRLFVDYDTSGAVGRAISQAIADQQNADDQIVFEALVSASGAGPTGIDAVSLINDSHSLGGSTYDNKTTSALSRSTYDSAVQAMSGFKKANGDPMGIFPTHLFVGPKLRSTAMEIVQAQTRLQGVAGTGALDSGTRVAAAGVSNVFAGEVTLVIWDRLTGTYDDYWYLMDLSKGVKPMLLKSERDYELVQLTDKESYQRFHTDDYVWSIEADKAPAAGAWPLIYGGIVS